MTDSFLADERSNFKDSCVEIISFDIGVKHLAYCTITKTKDINFDMFDISAKTPLDRLKNLNSALNTLPCANLVIVEQQVMTNTIAMTLQSAITMFYLSKGIEVKFYNPKNKFKIDGLKNFKNKEHKKISVSYARNILTKLEILTTPKELTKLNLNMLLKFEQFEKKDDVADCICMSLFTLLNDNNEIKKFIH